MVLFSGLLKFIVNDFLKSFKNVEFMEIMLVYLIVLFLICKVMLLMGIIVLVKKMESDL